MGKRVVAFVAIAVTLCSAAVSRARDLGDILVENKALLPEDRQLLDGLIDRQLKRHGSPEKSLEIPKMCRARWNPVRWARALKRQFCVAAQ